MSETFDHAAMLAALPTATIPEALAIRNRAVTAYHDAWIDAGKRPHTYCHLARAAWANRNRDRPRIKQTSEVIVRAQCRIGAVLNGMSERGELNKPSRHCQGITLAELGIVTARSRSVEWRRLVAAPEAERERRIRDEIERMSARRQSFAPSPIPAPPSSTANSAPPSSTANSAPPSSTAAPPAPRTAAPPASRTAAPPAPRTAAPPTPPSAIAEEERPARGKGPKRYTPEGYEVDRSYRIFVHDPEWAAFTKKMRAEGKHPSAVLGDYVRAQAFGPSRVKRDELSRAEQAKLDAAIRQHEDALNVAFEARVRAGVKERACVYIAETTTPEQAELLADAALIVARRKHIFTKQEWRLLVKCTHPDTGANVSEEQRNQAVTLLKKLRFCLCDEEEMPYAAERTKTTADYAGDPPRMNGGAHV